MSEKMLKKIISLSLSFTLLLQSLSPFIVTSVYADDSTSSATTADISPTPEATPTPESTPAADITPTIVVTPTPTPEATPSPEITPTTPDPQSQPQVNESNSEDNQPTPGVTLEITPTPTPAISEVLTVVSNLENTFVSTPIITTDKLDYFPTDRAYISGKNFVSNTPYTLHISSGDMPMVSYTVTVTTDQDGNFVYAYQLDGNYRPDYLIEVKSGDDVIATLNFTDSRSVLSATLNGSATTSVNPGATVNASVTVLTWLGILDLNDNWRSVSYKIGNNPAVCANTPNHNGFGLYNEPFSFNAPIVPGFYNVTFKAFSNDTCNSGGISLDYTLNSGLHVIADNIPPVITLIGTSSANIEIHSVYNDAGATALDNVNGNLTTSIITVNPVNVDLLGSYVITYDVTDVAGNHANQVTRTITVVDTNAPSIPTNGHPNGSFIPTNNFDFTWDSSIDSSAIHYVFHSSLNSTAINGILTTNLWTSGSLATNLIHSSGAPDGRWYWQVKAIDSVGNESSWSPIWDVTIDKTAPSTPTHISPANGSHLTTSALTLIDWSTEVDVNGPVSYIYQSSLSSSTNLDGSFALPAYTSGTITDSQISTAGTPEGIYYWHVRSLDALGNTSNWSTSWQVVVDNTNPTVDLVFPAPGTSATSFQAVFSEDVNQSDAENPANYFLNNWPGAGGSGDLMGDATIIYNPSIRTATITFADPNWYISPEQQWGVQNIHDLSGNLLSVSPYAEYSTNLVMPITTDTGTDSNWHNSSVTVNFSCTDIDGSGCKKTYYTTDGTTPTASSLFGSSVVLNTDGIFTVQYFSEDNAGNVEAVKTTTDQVKIDLTPPTLPVAASPSGDYFSDQLVTLTSSDLGSGLDKIYYTTDGTVPDSTKNLYVGPINVDHDMTINAIAYDNVGNYSSVLSAFYGIAPHISGESANSINTTVAVIKWTTDDLSTSRVVYDTVSHPSLDSSPNYGYANSSLETDNLVKVVNHTVTLNGLTPATTYYYRVISHGSPEAIGEEMTFGTATVGGSGISDGQSPSPSAPVCSAVRPGSSPTLLSAQAGLNSVTLTWSKAANPVTYYLITYGSAPGSQQYGNPNVGGSNTTSYTINGLSGGVKYYFQIRAGNECAPGEYSNEVSATPVGGLVTGPANGFAPGVLGTNITNEETVNPTPTISVTPVITPSVLGESTNKGNWNWLWLLLLVPAYVGYRLIFKKK